MTDLTTEAPLPQLKWTLLPQGYYQVDIINIPANWDISTYELTGCRNTPLAALKNLAYYIDMLVET